VVAEKLLELFKEKANPTTKEVTYDEFIAALTENKLSLKSKFEVKS
jgi:hypothetical protein